MSVLTIKGAKLRRMETLMVVFGQQAKLWDLLMIFLLVCSTYQKILMIILNHSTDRMKYFQFPYLKIIRFSPNCLVQEFVDRFMGEAMDVIQKQLPSLVEKRAKL